MRQEEALPLLASTGWLGEKPIPAKKKDSLVLVKDYLLRSRTKKFVGEKKLPALEFHDSYPPSPLSRYLQWPQFSDQWFLLSHPTNAEGKEKKLRKVSNQ